MRRHLIAVATLSAAALALTACGSTEATDTKAKPSTRTITLTDASGAEVKLDGARQEGRRHRMERRREPGHAGRRPGGRGRRQRLHRVGHRRAAEERSQGHRHTRRAEHDTIASLSPGLIVATTDLSACAVKQLRRIAPVLEVRSAKASDQIGQMEENLKKKLTDAGLAGSQIAFGDGYVASNQVSIRPYTSRSDATGPPLGHRAFTGADAHPEQDDVPGHGGDADRRPGRGDHRRSPAG